MSHPAYSYPNHFDNNNADADTDTDDYNHNIHNDYNGGDAIQDSGIVSTLEEHFQTNRNQRVGRSNDDDISTLGGGSATICTKESSIKTATSASTYELNNKYYSKGGDHVDGDGNADTVYTGNYTNPSKQSRASTQYSKESHRLLRNGGVGVGIATTTTTTGDDDDNGEYSGAAIPSAAAATATLSSSSTSATATAARLPMTPTPVGAIAVNMAGDLRRQRRLSTRSKRIIVMDNMDDTHKSDSLDFQLPDGTFESGAHRHHLNLNRPPEYFHVVAKVVKEHDSDDDSDDYYNDNIDNNNNNGDGDSSGDSSGGGGGNRSDTSDIGTVGNSTHRSRRSRRSRSHRDVTSTSSITATVPPPLPPLVIAQSMNEVEMQQALDRSRHGTVSKHDSERGRRKRGGGGGLRIRITSQQSQDVKDDDDNNNDGDDDNNGGVHDIYDDDDCNDCCEQIVSNSCWIFLAFVLSAVCCGLILLLVTATNPSTTMNTDTIDNDAPLPPISTGGGGDTLDDDDNFGTSPSQIYTPTPAPVPTISLDDNPSLPIQPQQPPQETQQPLLPVLETIRNRGYIRCRVASIDRNQGFGFTIDLCKALSAAIFDGDATRTEYPPIPWSDQWEMMSNGSIDVSTAFVTYNMGRDVSESNSRQGFSYTSPYLYSGSIIAGNPTFVDCAERGDTFVGSCSNLKICVPQDSTTEMNILKHLKNDKAAIYRVPNIQEMISTFSNTTGTSICNAMAGEPLFLAESRIREAGYPTELEYTMGTKFFSKDPLAIVSRGNDAQFHDFCEYVVQSLLVAEDLNITQARAYHEFPTTNLFGPDYEHMFQHLVATIGNYEELFERHYKIAFPRTGMNLLVNISSTDSINSGGGLMYPPPLGDVTVDFDEFDSIGPTPNGTLEECERRGRLKCGIVIGRGYGFAGYDETTQSWQGLDVDFCRAVAAAVLRTTEINDSDVIEWVLLDSSLKSFEALARHDIDIFAGAPFSMENDVQEPSTNVGFDFSPAYFYNSTHTIFSLATRENDPQWSDFVRWVVWSTMYASEEELNSLDAFSMPSVDVFGSQFHRMFRYVLLAVGNYDEIYRRSGLPETLEWNKINDGGTPQFLPLTQHFLNNQVT